jgi:hypothetical protein
VFARLTSQQFGGGPAVAAFDPLELGALEDPLELGALEDLLELGALEDPLELGALEDPLELGALEDPLELGALEDPLELGALEDPLELGALERPTSLSLGLNRVDITVSDSLGNTSSFNLNFTVSLDLPDRPLFGFAGPTAFEINGIVITPDPLVVDPLSDTDSDLMIQFNSEPGVTAQLDISALDDTVADAIVDLDLEVVTSLFTPFGLESYKATVPVSRNTTVGSGDKVTSLIVTSPLFDIGVVFESDLDSEVISTDLRDDFDANGITLSQNAVLVADVAGSQWRITDQENLLASPKTYRLTKLEDGQSISVGAVEETDVELALQISGESAAFRAVTASANQDGVVVSSIEINARPDGRIYTNAPEIPLAGQVPAGTGDEEVEVFVNGNSMGVTTVAPDETFRLDRILLTPGNNTITAFTRSASQLQSPISAPQTVIFDRTPPTAAFVDLPTHTSEASLSVTTQFSDNFLTTPESVTLVVNGASQPVATQQNTTRTTVELKEGENLLALSAIDAAGNISAPVEATVIFDPTQLDTAPTALLAGLSFSGTEVTLNWEADANAGAYNLYRSESPITGVSELTPISANLAATQFTDTNVNLAVTYYYALTSLSQAGVEGARVSDNVNATILFAARGGTASISDGTRLTALAGGISEDPTLYTSISIERPSMESLPSLRDAIEGTARRFAATSQSGSTFIDLFVLPATTALPYPADTESPEKLQVFFLEDEKWTQLADTQVDTDLGAITVSGSQFGTYQLATVTEQPWDVNSDARVDIFDLVIVGGEFGKTPPDDPRADVDANDTVNLFDLVSVGSHFGEVYDGAAASAPPAQSHGSGAQVSMSAEQSTRMARGLKEQIVTVAVNAETAQPLGGFMLDVQYNPYLLAVVDVQEGTPVKRSEGNNFWLKPKFQPGRVAKIASVILAEAESMHTGQTLANLTFRLKGSIDDALESIQIQNLALSDRDAQMISFHLDKHIRYDRQPEPMTYRLAQNYPNPFNPETWLPYALADAEDVNIQIYDASGHLVRTLDLGFQAAGSYMQRDKAAYWDGRNLTGEKVATGIYFYQIQAGEFVATRKMVILK